VRIGQITETTDNRKELRMARLTRDLLNESANDLPAHIVEKLAKARNLALTHRQLEKNGYGNGSFLLPYQEYQAPMI